MPKKKKTITAEDLYRFELITDIDMSPDGSTVVFAQQRVDRGTEKNSSNLWIVPTRGGAPVQFTRGDQSDSHPRFSPDGKEIAFISNRGSATQPQIYKIPIDGGEAYQLTKFTGMLFGFRWSPDGKSFVVSFLKKDADVAEREKDEKKKKLGVVARRYDRPFYKMDGFGFLPKERLHLWTVNAKSGKAVQLTDHEVFDESDPYWTNDGKNILFVSNRNDEPDLNIYENSFYTVPVKGGKIKKIPTFRKGEMMGATFSQDGKWISFLGREGSGDWWRNIQLFVMASNGKSAPVSLTGKFDIDCNFTNINDIVGAMIMTRPTWSSDGKSLYFQVSRHGDTVLKKITVETGEIEDIIVGEGAVGKFCFDSKQEKIVWFHADRENVGQIFVRDMKSGKEKQLTKVNESFINKLDLGEIEEFWFKGSDKNDLQGWILKPPGFNPKKKYPSILEIHGGPLMMYGNLFMHEFYYLASKGYVVYFCNPRGGQGYGEKHSKAINNNWGTKDYEDLMKFTDLMVRKPYIDKDRMGVTGGSYGGYMTNWIIGHTNRFKAAVTQRSVSNLISMWGSSDFNWIFQEAFGNKPPWENLANYWKQSPMKYIGNAVTPTLVIHNEADHRCQIEQGEQVFIALKTLGVDTEFLRFPDEPHGLSRGGRTDRRIERLNAISGWFDKYLKKKR